jgi:outer membrane protein OmpA-like peptidoglycan-associated protein
MSYFAPVLGYRGSVVLRLDEGWLQPHVLAGGGGESVFSSSPFIRNETDPVIYYGIGTTFDVMPGWQLRIDGRQGFMPAKDGTTAITYELLLGIGTRFGAHRAPVAEEHVEVAVTEPVKPPPDPDSDGDGVPDSRDKCPNQPAQTADGCPLPDPDTDGDGIPDSRDKCPDQPEDFDHFQDEDGCPDPDNDNDGIPDAKDACPNDAETKNGFDDDDGCPDTVPPDVLTQLAAAKSVKFERVRITEAGKAALDKVLPVLRAHPGLHVVITAHADKDTNTDVAKKRAEIVKWYFVEQGVPADQLDIAVADAAKNAIELVVAPKQ